MAVNLSAPQRLEPIAGVRLAAVAAGIRKQRHLDLSLFELAAGTQLVARFTRNRFAAAPVIVARQNLSRTPPRYLLINSGNANAGLGDLGVTAAQTACAALAGLTDAPEQSVLPFSTGVIGEPLPVERITAALPELLSRLDGANWLAVADAIRTTDTVAKGCSVTFQTATGTATVTGIAKGSGMIRPDMATMLAFVATDATVSRQTLDRVLGDAVNGSFNRITVDGDTSTNDACVLAATGAGTAVVDESRTADVDALAAAVMTCCRHLAQAIVRDGEGATRFVTVTVKGAANGEDARRVAYAVAHSPLVKTALFAGDPNWGRILAAVGYAETSKLDIDRVCIDLGDVCIVRGGTRAQEYTEDAGKAVMQRSEIEITIDLGLSESSVAPFQLWTTDFSYDYVRINAEYRS